MKKLFLLLVLPILFFASCKTNPPIVPIDDRVSGKIFLTINFNFNPQSKTVNKVVLLEDFANISCQPCVASNLIIHSLETDVYGSEKLVTIKYPTNFPGPNDIFYTANRPACNAKISFYNVLFAPTTIIDGLRILDTTLFRQKIDERLLETPPFEIIINDEFVSGSFYVDIQINSLTSLGLTDIFLEAVVLEEKIEFESPPGSNGETKFYNVMREVLPSTEGISLATVRQSGSNTIETEGDIRAGWQTDQVKTVVFIQNRSTKEVLQAGISRN